MQQSQCHINISVEILSFYLNYWIVMLDTSILWLTTDDSGCEKKYPRLGKYGYLTITGFPNTLLKIPPIMPMKPPPGPQVSTRVHFSGRPNINRHQGQREARGGAL
ncbi:hypothetical protein DESC_40096 [Desulfosarcina cetonica]|nr:hypothetical protein DESC_40096 [Desulfosarcina cetonica]